MRDSLRKSLADAAPGFEKYPKGSIVVCNACAQPVFKLDRAICLGDKAGQSASAFKPLSLDDLVTLSTREDIDAGIRANILAMDEVARQVHVQCLREMRAGDPMLCPLCNDTFVQVLAVEAHEVLDRSYVIELLTIPPIGVGTPAPVRGRRLGATKEWLH